MPENYWFYIFASLLLVTVFGYLIWLDWRDRRDAEIEVTEDELDELIEKLKAKQEKQDEQKQEFMNWIASLSMAVVLIQKDLQRIADKLCEGTPTADVKGEAPEDRKQSLYEEGIQNILNYGMEQMRNRGDGN